MSKSEVEGRNTRTEHFTFFNSKADVRDKILNKINHENQCVKIAPFIIRISFLVLSVSEYCPHPFSSRFNIDLADIENR